MILVDNDGYPTEEELEIVRNWENNYNELLEFVYDLWRYPDYITRKEQDDKTIWNISTGGWSGNEDLIEALQDNGIFWILCWYQSRRGGHYVFEVKNENSSKY